jgi:hypothetical protein
LKLKNRTLANDKNGSDKKNATHPAKQKIGTGIKHRACVPLAFCLSDSGAADYKNYFALNDFA